MIAKSSKQPMRQTVVTPRIPTSTPKTGDMCVITCYFNPHGYRTKKPNFELFCAGMRRARIPLYVAELAFGDSPFELNESVCLLRLRSPDVIWQKERLLNLLISSLPSYWKKIAWVDCDILFEDTQWLERASHALDNWLVIQPFSEAVRLPRTQTRYRGEGEVYQSFCSRYREAPDCVRRGVFDLHGHTGFAWAARREVLDGIRLYDASVSSSGDHLMAHAFVGDFDSSCVKYMAGPSGALSAHFALWAMHAFGVIAGRIGFTNGRILHLWHGETKERRYYLRNAQLHAFAFDPNTDLRLTAEGTWMWASDKPALHRWSRLLFGSRNEDGTLTGSIVQLVSTRKFG